MKKLSSGAMIMLSIQFHNYNPTANRLIIDGHTFTKFSF